MKINSEQPAPSAYRFKNESSLKGDAFQGGVSGAVGQGSDRLVLSGNSTKIDQLKAMMKQLPDDQQGKVAQLRQQITDGSYQVAAAKTAGKMLDSWRGLNAC